MAAEPASELFLFGQEYFSARQNDSEESDTDDWERDDERSDDGDSSSANLDDTKNMTKMRELDKEEIKDVQRQI